MSTTTPTLFDDVQTTHIAQEFMAWKQLEGAGKVMWLFYRKAARFFRRFQRTGVGVSQRLIEELVRDDIRRRAARGVQWEGYTLNSHFTAHIVRHMAQRRPEWSAMFELREIGKPRVKRRIIIEEAA